MSYIAKEPIFFGNTRAHNPGDHVPEENVKANGWEDLVVKAGTKAAQAIEQAAGADQEGLPTLAQSPAPK